MTFLLPLLLVSLASTGIEIALTRYFAVASWSEYGYWVISIVMAGFALSGVATALLRSWLERHSVKLFAFLPGLLILSAALGYAAAIRNPFNPLQLQNPVTIAPQILYIGLYYLELLPFFFLTGLFISLCFVSAPTRTTRVYAFDLCGAGLGALIVLGLMAVLHPFKLIPALLLPLAAMAFFVPRDAHRLGAIITAGLCLIAGETLLIAGDVADYNQFKPIYAPLHTPNARIRQQILSPRGVYSLLDDFTERVDTDLSNDSAMMHLPGPPRTLGLYRDGSRIAAIPRPGKLDVGYAPGTLAAAPYELLSHPRVLAIGDEGGWAAAQAQALGAGSILADEPEPVLRAALQPQDSVTVSGESPLALVSDAPSGRFDLIELSDNFLGADPADATAFTSGAIALYLHALSDQGMVSIPVSIRDFPVYALRMMATIRAGLLQAGIADPGAHVIVYRSAWNVRLLIAKSPFDSARIKTLRKFCDDRSFDVSFFPGIDVASLRDDIYNDLPAISFSKGEVESGGQADDSIADEAVAVMNGQPTDSAREFDLRPATLDRPMFFDILRLDHLGTILKRLEILPQQELGPLINIAVLAQAFVVALIVLLLPLAAPRRIGRARAPIGRALLYFPALGLGYLFIEIALIGEASLYLDDVTTAFALVLSGMLIFSGLGSMAANRMRLRFAWLVILALLILTLVALPAIMLATIGWPMPLRLLVLLILLAPLSLALGQPFPMGLGEAGKTGAGFLPWAWALNGAFSVIATPLANLIATELGFRWLILAALLLYGVAWLSFPKTADAQPAA
ncbi:hypothetical protein ACELLULO517_03470 [Acidisoma cellulosilytica]|uniref:Spermidine synthase n=1 Tax=Acidisoma cellulosilyticum TaxID=2802395 RepID=A0A963YYN6_9PROT|nr:hypothetical protein [Acidisoma cellulosilyticum]MCB8879281.1 hypothetical protein [Acidisoma cellulosilyticum]